MSGEEILSIQDKASEFGLSMPEICTVRGLVRVTGNVEWVYQMGLWLTSKYPGGRGMMYHDHRQEWAELRFATPVMV